LAQIPLEIDTAKQSIANPVPIIMIERISIKKQ